MRLLVSVRSADEAVLARECGADIIDAKEPSAGPLGPVSPAVLGAILRALPPEVPVGVALGDMDLPDTVPLAIARLPLAPRPAPLFLKIGFAGVVSGERIAALLRRAVETAAALPAPASVIATAYADYDRAGSAAPATISDAAIAAGAGGVLIDTWEKDGRTLLDRLGVAELRSWVGRMRSAGMLTALAGSLGPEAISAVAEADPDVVGVRGAACSGGRGGSLDPARLRRLRARLDPAPHPAS
jgi:uncharacterized protein (UPF0264 family)